jgi:hypothetical protein
MFLWLYWLSGHAEGNNATAFVGDKGACRLRLRRSRQPKTRQEKRPDFLSQPQSQASRQLSPQAFLIKHIFL